jgi:hypothetical protein
MTRHEHVTTGGTFVLSRRDFINAALAVAAGWLLPKRICVAAEARPDADMFTILSDPDAAGRLGRAYLAGHSDEADANKLSELLRNALQAYPGGLFACPSALKSAFVALVLDEYVSLPMVTVDGWLLAPSEARLYALAALSDGLPPAFQIPVEARRVTL